MDPQALFKLAKDVAGNPMLALAAISAFVAGYCDDHGVDRETFCKMVRGQPHKPIDGTSRPT